MGMGGGFTKQSTAVLDLASEAAHELNNEYIDPEHILIGLLRADAEASRVFKQLDLDVSAIELETRKVILPGEQPVKIVKLPLSRRSKETFEYAIGESNPFQKGGRLADSADLIVGILLENNSAAASILTKYGLTVDRVRSAAKNIRDSAN
jgi:ATP-dependent Clp protease ATP-binding subunit ClpA